VKLARRLLLSLVAFLVAIPLLIVLAQDVQVYPRAFDRGSGNFREPLPADVESFWLPQADGCRAEVWRLAPPGVNRWMLIIHGNGDTLEDFYQHQESFEALGWGSYSLDYRGFGRADCWPKEAAIYRDADNFVAEARRREGEGAQMVLVGYSLGSGIASHAALAAPGLPLALVSPYSSIPDVVLDNPILRPLASFLWSEFPTKDRIAKLGARPLFIAATPGDLVVPYSHAERLRALVGAETPLEFVTTQSAHHGRVIFDAIPHIAAWAEKLR